jgi:hypothetical protein
MNTKPQHTPGPWRWEFNEKHRSLHLVGGKPQYDLTIIDFERWGMSGATMRLRDTAHDGMNLMSRVHERTDWIAPEPGREHHKSWHQLLTHPDARLIEASPMLLKALRRLSAAAAARDNTMGDQCALFAAQAELRDANKQACEAIASATT